MSGPVVGIDLGTVNSVVTSVDNDGRVVVLPNSVGGEITPSAVYFEPDGAVIVGEEALRATVIDPANGVQLIKRNIGSEFPLTLRGQDHTPESISALILRQLVAAGCGPVAERVRAVITVPAYFGLAEREATFQAGVIAGLDVLELLDEPVAAAAHYGLTAGSPRTVLVYDLGGGTFDTTVLRIAAGSVTVRATDGHHALGGADIDQRLLDLVLDRLSDLMTPDDLDEISGDERRLAELALDVEAAKCALSGRTSHPVVVHAPSGRHTVDLNRADLDAMCADLFDTTGEIIERVLGAAGVGPHAIDEVIMVGGSSRIPLLASRLESMFSRTPRLVEPELAVAKGAALRAHHLAATPQRAALARSSRAGNGAANLGRVAPVTPRAIGILIEDSHDPAGKRSFIEHLVPANAPLPVTEVTERFGTILAEQRSVRIQVYEQAGPARSPEVEHNRLVLDGELSGIGSLPAGSVIRISMGIAVDGRLTVVAHEPVSGRELRLEAYVAGVVDHAETERLTRLVGRALVRG